MPVDPNVQTTSGGTLSKGLVTYYDRRLLENTKPRLVHQKFGQKRQIPKNNGKTVDFRKFTPLLPNTTPLQEGVTPDGDSLAMTNVQVSVEQYGNYVTGSDLLDLVHIDPVLDETTELLGDQAGLSIDHVTRDAMALASNVQYAGGKTYRYELTRDDKLTSTEIRKAVRTLKQNKAKPFMRNGKPYFYAIIDQDTAYDLMDDERWLAVADYQKGEKIEDGEIGKLYGVVFFETTEAKRFSPTPLSAGSVALTVASWTKETKTIVVSETLTEADAAALEDQTVLLRDVSASSQTIKEVTIQSVTHSTKSIVIDIDDDTLGFAPAAGDKLFSDDGGQDGDDVNVTMVFGKDAYGVIDIEGEGAIKNIIKPVGSAGTNDPLDQRWTSGWKVPAYAAKVLQDDWIVLIEHGFSR